MLTVVNDRMASKFGGGMLLYVGRIDECMQPASMSLAPINGGSESTSDEQEPVKPVSRFKQRWQQGIA